MWFFKIISLILQTFAGIILNPELYQLQLLMWLVILLVALQYRRIVAMREALFGLPGEGVIHLTATSLLYGIVAGFIGSVVITAIGISVNNVGFNYLWPLAILLMLINIRFLCFSYAGGILSLSYLIFGFPKIDIPQLMALVGLLHLIEAVLIYLNGHHDAVPVYTRTESGKVVGGYTMQKFWPIPVGVLMFVTLQNPDYANNGLQMPNWWPLIKANLHLASPQNIQYLILPVAAALGYGDIAITSLPHEKSRLSALYLLIYSAILLGLAIVASNLPFVTWIAALFSPLGHEMVIKLGKDAEMTGTPLFQKEEGGLRVFEVLPDSPAQKAGLKRGDFLVHVNKLPVSSKDDFSLALAELPWHIEIDYIPYGNTEIQHTEVRKSIPQPFGVLFPPEPWEQANVNLSNSFFLKKVFGKIFHKLFHR